MELIVVVVISAGIAENSLNGVIRSLRRLCYSQIIISICTCTGSCWSDSLLIHAIANSSAVVKTKNKSSHSQQ